LLVGIDRFMSECRAITNLIGNGVATVIISRWEGELSARTLRDNLRRPKAGPAPPPQTAGAQRGAEQGGPGGPAE
jgi:aerobic C4-dicarboxylate transport protein